MTMKKLLFMVGCVWILSSSAEAPPSHVKVEYKEPEPKVDYPFGIEDHSLLSVMWYESRFNKTAVNPVSGARGVLQILPIMINEANRLRRLQGSDIRYTWDDAWDVEKSIEIWYLVQNYHNPDYDLQKACMIWFGRGVQYDGKTWREYHRDVHQYLISLSEKTFT